MQIKLTQGYVNQLSTPEKITEFRDKELRGLLLRCLPSGRKIFYVDYRRSNGKRTRYKLGTADVLSVAQAKDATKEFLANLELGEDLGESRRKASVITLGYFLEHHYGPWVIENRKSGKLTLRRIQSSFKELMDTPMNSLDVWSMEKWRTARLKNRGLKRVTVNRDIAVLKAALNCAKEWGFITENPISKIRKLKETDSKEKLRYLTPKEYQRLIAALDAREKELRDCRDRFNSWRDERGYDLYPDLNQLPFADHLKPMILIALNSGIRRSELFHLEWSDIDIKHNTLTVRAESAKSGKMRHVKMNKTLRSTLINWKKCCGNGKLVFPGKEGKPFTNCNKSWAKIMKAAGILEFTWHDMRHDFASQSIMAGVDLNTVRELLGHTDIRTTQIYSHLAPEHKQVAVDMLEDARSKFIGATEEEETIA